MMNNLNDHLIYSWVAQRDQKPLVITRASGVHIWDEGDNRYIDLASAQISVNVGYGRPEIHEAIVRQLAQVAYVAPTYRTEVEISLAEAVAQVTPTPLQHVFFTNTGSEGVETAMKIARAVTNRTKIYSSWQSYHGSSQASSAVSGDPRRLFGERGGNNQPKFLFPNSYRNPFGVSDPALVAELSLKLLEQQLMFEGPETVAALLVEPIVGTSGLYIPDKIFIAGLRRLCDEHGIILIFDETMTGWGRTGEWFASDLFGVCPDILVTAKGITSGYVPLGCVVMTQAIYEHFLDQPFVAGSTTEGHALGCAAGLANIAIYRSEGLVERSRWLGQKLLQQLEHLKSNHPSVGDVRGRGLFACIELTADRSSRSPLAGYRDSQRPVANRLIGRLRELGVSTIAKWDFLFIAPPLTITMAELSEALNKIDRVLFEFDDLISR